MKETFEEARERIHKRLRDASDWVAGAIDWLKILDAQGIPRRSNSMIDVLLGFCGAKTEREKANENYWRAIEEQDAARAEWDNLGKLYAVKFPIGKEIK